jgi:NO-binding membrane sensor protein with MHYT domain
MIGGFLAAWLLIPYRPDFVFPMSAIAVGAHYFGFRTAYGDWTNWILGGIMCAVGIASIFYGMPASGIVAYVISAIEVCFGLCLTWIGIAKESTDALAGPDANKSG